LDQKLHKYQKIANEVILEVFQKEYCLLSLPIPQIRFMSKDEEDYRSGQYKIQIGKTWQIQLNFGKLPQKVADFKREVRVITRHEIEHYRSCPFDVISQLRMVRRVIDTNSKHINPLPPNRLKLLAPQIVNEVADVIVDTINFIRYPNETLRSEIEWIAKTSSNPFPKYARHSKLLSLLKAELWKADLDLYETDPELLAIVQLLADEFQLDGIANSNSFLSKTELYTNRFLDLFEIDKNEYEQLNPADFDLGNRADSVSSNGTGSVESTQMENQWQSLPCKEDTNNGAQVLVSAPEKIASSINQLAQETSIDEFELILDIMGIKFKGERESQKIWFEQNNVDAIPILSERTKSSNEDMSYPSQWKIGDPLEDLDLFLSLQTSPKILPGITTKKWEQQYSITPQEEKNNSDLLLVIDTSGSMGNNFHPGSRMHEAVLACFGFIRYFEEQEGKISLVNFSSGPIVCDWTRDYGKIKDTLLINQGGSTNFPTQSLVRLTEQKRDGSVVVIITDGSIQNWEKTLNLLTELCYLNNDVFLFLMGDEIAVNTYSELRNVGGFVEHALTVNDIRESVFNHI
jgi:hypothetical protein